MQCIRNLLRRILCHLSLPSKICPMKTIRKISLVVITIVFLTTAGTRAASSDDAISIQKALLSASMERKTADVAVEIVVMIPDLPQIKPITFEDEAEIPYTLADGSVEVAGRDVPTLYAALNDVPASFKPITIALKPEGGIRAGTDEGGRWQVQDTNIRVKIYKKKRGEISEATKPIVNFLLKGVAISTKESDIENGVFIFQWDAMFPKVGNDLFDSYLAGKTMDALVTINAK